MKKVDFVKKLAKALDVPTKQADKTLNKVFEEITKVLKDGDSLRIQGFGSFSTVDRAARDVRNPNTGETIKIPARTAVKFKAGKTLKDLVA